MGIGVTDFIALEDVRKKFERTYPNQCSGVESELQVEHEAYDHSLLGTAFDYVLRFWLEAKCEETYEPEPIVKRWLLPERDPDTGRLVLGSDEEYGAFTRAEKKREIFVETGGMNVTHAVDAALLFAGAQLDIEDEGSQIRKNSFEDDVVSELQELFHLVREQDSLIGEVAILEPTFGSRSYILEGHGDFIVDNTLIDVKTTENTSFTPNYWRQLLAYYVLNDVHRELDGEYGSSDIPYPSLEEVGIYFARYGELRTVEIDSVIDSRDEYERFRAWFVDRAIQENHDDRRNYEVVREILTEPYDFEEQRPLSDF